MKLDPPKRIETKRLLLRMPKMEDAKLIFDGYTSNPEIPYYMSWVAHTELSQTEGFIKYCIESWQAKENFEYVIELRENNELPIGMIGMHPLSKNPKGVGFGYVIAKKYWNQGYVSEALKNLVDWALNQKQIYRAEAFCDVENKASAKVMKKAGMEFEGRLKRYFVHPNISHEPRDSLMYSKSR